jgi:hypothetical protein
MDSIEACFDGKEPKVSNDTSLPRFTWWPKKGTTEWVIRQFDSPRRVSTASVYWFDDSGAGGCRVPASWQLFYRAGDQWKPVDSTNPPSSAPNQYNQISFTPVTTTEVKIEARLKEGFSAGILEWKTE